MGSVAYPEAGLPSGDATDLENNPKAIQDEYHLLDIEIPKDCADILNEGPVPANSVNSIVLSHLHFDHTGDCMKFPQADLIVGPGSQKAIFPGWPEAAGSPFDGSILKHPKFRELSFESDKWASIGPFARAIDWFLDGSFFVIDTPGHMDGHLGALARTGSQEWVFMGGDCCHHRSLLTGTRPMSITVGPSKTPSFHRYPEKAQGTIGKIRELEKHSPVLVALAHDATLDGLMPLYPTAVNGWKVSEWKKKLDKGLHKDYPEIYPGS
ncbi:hypothetical protein H2200_012813 [Cladophialophora chaetospira]|uniref:Metallo-beta-lactamase domain-containing protein n=1 Tax=Cladophialophora chaetospira TaxID=386627 RepID=A0AA38WWU5_9EURO|nr:hypothetical protein H2200_012813 [Cladophialophora chaetospira]